MSRTKLRAGHHMHFLNVVEVYYTLLSAPSLRVAIGLLLQMMFIVAEGTVVMSLLATSYLQARSAAGFVRQPPKMNSK